MQVWDGRERIGGMRKWMSVAAVMVLGMGVLGVQQGGMGTGKGQGGTTGGGSVREAVTAYYIGHSLISDIPDMVGGLAKAGGVVAFSFKEQFIPGAALRWQWEERERSAGKPSDEPQFRVRWFEAFPTGKFDTLVMIDSVPRGPKEMGDTREYAGKLIGEAVKGNSKTRVFIYEPWHCLKTGTPEGCAYDKSSPTRDLKWPERVAADSAMWDKVVEDLKKDHPGVEIRLIPAARGLARLEAAILKGEVAGMKTLEDCFSDEIHTNPYGKYFIACLHYAMLTGKSPVGLPVEVKDRWGRSYWHTPNWEKKSWKAPEAGAVRKMQEIAWDVAQGK